MLSLMIPFLFSSNLWSQEVGLKVNGIEANSDETTITVKKGGRTDVQYQVTEGSDELAGDPAPLQKEARANWKKACDEWRKELKELNKDNQILAMSCGTPQCVTSAMETVCKSTTKHKLKTRVN